MAAHCRGCGREILWAETRSGKRIPLDPEPSVAGNVVLEQASSSEGGLEVFRALFLAPGSSWPSKRYVSHFSTCPAAARFRHPRPGPKGAA